MRKGSWYLVTAMAVTLGVGACGDDPVDVAMSTCGTIGPVVAITDNHLPSGGDHELVITAADVVAGLSKVYDIRGDNVGHTHTVTVTADDFHELQEGEAITVTSSNNGPVGIGHDHTVVVSCP